ncbi:acyl carrier protein [Microseira sp. BLCC-F43]|uniref:acyl carrier protein n=1 Tax=Microseira sp. BLCC-F43 TaxID=3153602 RepID=UPI0035B6E86D
MQTEIGESEKVISFEAIQKWLVSYIAEIMEVTSDEIDVKVTFDEYGLDSSMSVAMVADLETWLGRTLEPTLIYDYPTLEKLAKYVSQI